VRGQSNAARGIELHLVGVGADRRRARYGSRAVALVPNPVADLKPLLQRIEGAIGALSKDLTPVQSLPALRKETAETNKTLRAVLEELRGLREDLAASDGPPPTRRTRAAAGSRRDGRRPG
jgi:hypothetical protein